MTRRLALVGGGGFGREVLDIVDALNAAAVGADSIDVIGVFDDGQPDTRLLDAFGVRHLGPVALVQDLPHDIEVSVGIAHPKTRHRVVGLLGDRRRPALIHPTATMGRRVDVGRGAVICSHVSIANHVVIGDDVHIGANSAVGHDCELGPCVTVSPHVAVSGNIVLRERAFLGTGSALNQGLSVGSDAVIGSGATVIRDVASGTTVVGTPASVRS